MAEDGDVGRHDGFRGRTVTQEPEHHVERPARCCSRATTAGSPNRPRLRLEPRRRLDAAELAFSGEGGDHDPQESRSGCRGRSSQLFYRSVGRGFGQDVQGRGGVLQQIGPFGHPTLCAPHDSWQPEAIGRGRAIPGAMRNIRLSTKPIHARAIACARAQRAIPLFTRGIVGSFVGEAVRTASARGGKQRKPHR